MTSRTQPPTRNEIKDAENYRLVSDLLDLVLTNNDDMNPTICEYCKNNWYDCIEGSDT